VTEPLRGPRDKSRHVDSRCQTFGADTLSSGDRQFTKHSSVAFHRRLVTRHIETVLEWIRSATSSSGRDGPVRPRKQLIHQWHDLEKQKDLDQMNRNHLRRRFSLVFPALVFLSLSLLETVEVTTIAETVVSLGTENAQSVPLVPAGHVEKAVHCPNAVCGSPQGCRRFTDV
jgi:hypothetical protein